MKLKFGLVAFVSLAIVASCGKKDSSKSSEPQPPPGLTQTESGKKLQGTWRVFPADTLQLENNVAVVVYFTVFKFEADKVTMHVRCEGDNGVTEVSVSSSIKYTNEGFEVDRDVVENGKIGIYPCQAQVSKGLATVTFKKDYASLSFAGLPPVYEITKLISR